MDKKKRIVLEVGDDTALFVEQDQAASHLATMYPFKQSDLTLKMWRTLGGCVFACSVLFIIMSLGIYGLSIGLRGTFPDHAFIVNFACVGLFLGSAVLVREMFMGFRKELQNNHMDLVRFILRDMKSQSGSGTIEQYSINSSYLYNGMDGDFITWYKQEKINREQRIIGVLNELLFIKLR